MSISRRGLWGHGDRGLGRLIRIEQYPLSPSHKGTTYHPYRPIVLVPLLVAGLSSKLGTLDWWFVDWSAECAGPVGSTSFEDWLLPPDL